MAVLLSDRPERAAAEQTEVLQVLMGLAVLVAAETVAIIVTEVAAGRELALMMVGMALQAAAAEAAPLALGKAHMKQFGQLRLMEALMVPDRVAGA
jgi:hypothetical protein